MLTKIRTRQEYLGLSLRALSKQLEVSPALLLTLLGISASLQFIQYLIFQPDTFVGVRSSVRRVLTEPMLKHALSTDAPIRSGRCQKLASGDGYCRPRTSDFPCPVRVRWDPRTVFRCWRIHPQRWWCCGPAKARDWNSISPTLRQDLRQSNYRTNGMARNHPLKYPATPPWR